MFNLSGETFRVGKLGVLTSVINARRPLAEVRFHVKSYAVNSTASSDAFNDDVYTCTTVKPIVKTNHVLHDSPELTRAATDIKKHEVIRVLTDCSCYDMPLVALTNLGRPVNHTSPSDNCLAAKRSIQANHNPKDVFDDIARQSCLWS